MLLVWNVPWKPSPLANLLVLTHQQWFPVNISRLRMSRCSMQATPTTIWRIIQSDCLGSLLCTSMAIGTPYPLTYSRQLSTPPGPLHQQSLSLLHRIGNPQSQLHPNHKARTSHALACTPVHDLFTDHGGGVVWQTLNRPSYIFCIVIMQPLGNPLRLVLSEHF